MSALQMICIPPEEVWKLWPGPVHDMIDAAFAAADMPLPQDIAEQFKYGHRLLWLVVDTDARIVAAITTQLFEMRSGKICKITESGGSRLAECLPLKAQIEEYAKREGCDRVLIEGRPGWAGVFRDYRTTSIVLEKRI